ncbi:hypothetical protein FIV34_17635 [Luteibacter pinisoli]|uniref:Uncharacterized protein n=1 Tax=Luteibacter pinisoli TaxID=2589080 RepID=A0A4Y5Z625_9GAMM|nr:hypothetical protein [Luteibacter pinisoli]QDE40902.1 hypothetical protein FIV34_17635 [Luteibacter pinisoli]
MSDLSEFELKVLRLALRGDEPWRHALRSQVPHLSVDRREVFAGGATTHFTSAGPIVGVVVPRGEDGLPVKSYPPTVTAIRDDPVPGLASFVVWVGQEGTIVELEAFSLVDDAWPEEPEVGFHSFQDDAGNLLDIPVGS